mmetsp:Transcript_60241/g.161647  ORF Transcript_60241/g.161647 Transcript_60241/m.161647 type:complete len:219 (-) Transcript_60241:336-992(-)
MLRAPGGWKSPAAIRRSPPLNLSLLLRQLRDLGRKGPRGGVIVLVAQKFRARHPPLQTHFQPRPTLAQGGNKLRPRQPDGAELALVRQVHPQIPKCTTSPLQHLSQAAHLHSSSSGQVAESRQRAVHTADHIPDLPGDELPVAVPDLYGDDLGAILPTARGSTQHPESFVERWLEPGGVLPVGPQQLNHHFVEGLVHAHLQLLAALSGVFLNMEILPA